MNQITTGTLEEAYKRISKVCKDLNIDFDEFIEWYVQTGKCKNVKWIELYHENKNRRKVKIDYSKGTPCNQKCDTCPAYVYRCPWSKKDGM